VLRWQGRVALTMQFDHHADALVLLTPKTA
jgi:hypothetical protein